MVDQHIVDFRSTVLNHGFDLYALTYSDLPVERLPFSIRVVSNQEDMSKAVQIRHAAYARHVPHLATKLTMPELHDAEDGVVVLLAESKADGTPLGTMRIETNLYRPLTLEQSVTLPSRFHGLSMAEATRLGVTDTHIGRIVKTVLFKAFFLFCQKNRVKSMVVAGRSPIDRQYERLLFSEVCPGMGYIPLAHAANIPHRIMSFDVETAEARWAAASHPLFTFIFRTRHPDINLSSKAWDQRPTPIKKVHQAPTFVQNIAVKSM